MASVFPERSEHPGSSDEGGSSTFSPISEQERSVSSQVSSIEEDSLLSHSSKQKSPVNTDEGESPADNENHRVQATPLFNPQKTVVFYPIYKRFPDIEVTDMINFFGDVETMKYFTKDEAGCVVVVYKTTGSVYSAWNCVRELKDYLNLVQYLQVDILWPPVSFNEALETRDRNKEISAAVKENRVVQIPITGKVTIDYLTQELPHYGPSESFSITMENGKTVYHGIFKNALDSIACVCLGSEMSALLYIGENQDGEEILGKPSVLVRYPLKAYIRDYEVATVYRNINTSYQMESVLFSNPIEIFGNGVSPEYPNAIRLPLIGSSVSTLFIAMKKSGGEFRHYEIEFFVSPVSTGGMELIDKNSGSNQWVSYFFLELERRFCDTHFTHRLGVKIRSVNYIFPKLYPQLFAEEKSYNFTFAKPLKHTVKLSSRAELNQSREAYADYLVSINQNPNGYRKPYLCFLIPNSGNRCCSSSSCLVPVVIHSHEVDL